VFLAVPARKVGERAEAPWVAEGVADLAGEEFVRVPNSTEEGRVV